MLPTTATFSALCVCILGLTAASSVVAQDAEGGSSIAITRRNLLPLTDKDGTVLFDNLAQSVQFTKDKYHSTRLSYQRNHGYPIPGTPPLELTRNLKRDGVIPLTAQSGGAFWSGEITLGHQKFVIDFDTGSADLWVPSINCTTSACMSKNRYDDSKEQYSKQFPNRKFSISYVDGSGVSGGVYTDIATLGGVGCSGIVFSAVTKLDTTLNDDPVDGILGMGYRSLSNLGVAPAWNTLYGKRTDKFGKNMFSFYLSEDQNAGSHLYLGGYDTSKFSGNIYWNKVTQQAYWQIGGGTAYSNGKASPATGLSAIIDTGTTLIYAPNATVAKIFANVDGARYWQNNYWTFPCASAPKIGFSFNGGPNFEIPAADLSLGRTSFTSTQCVAGIIAQSFAGNAILMGDLFLKNVYSIYSFADNTVGFAALKSGSSPVLALTRPNSNPQPSNTNLAMSRPGSTLSRRGDDSVPAPAPVGAMRHKQMKSRFSKF